MEAEPELTRSDLAPLRRRRHQCVSRDDFVAVSRDAPGISVDAFRADQAATLDYVTGPYDR
jgi:hypothetical protein